MGRPATDESVRKVREGDVRAVARALTKVESQSHDRETRRLLKELFSFTGTAFVIGVTGSPGAGKSTLVDQLIQAYRRAGKRVGVIAVDPSSPFSGGALLGDRVRMQTLSSDPGVFIRSMATRGQMGGLAPAIQEALVVLDAARYEVLIVETVGAGQDEVDIVKTADISIVVLVPGMGDDVQTIKAGIMEIGDIFVINKADREGAARTELELKALLSLGTRWDGWIPPIVRTVATVGTGTTELVQAIGQYRDYLARDESGDLRRFQVFKGRLISAFRDQVTEVLLDRISEEELDSMVKEMVERTSDPYTLVERLLDRVGLQIGGGEKQ